MQSDDFVPLDEAVNVLASLCNEGQTGLMYWETPQHQSATIGLSNGRIVNVSSESKINQAALSMLATLEKVSYRFSSRSYYRPPRFAPLPENAEIFQLLLEGQAPSEREEVEPAATTIEASLANEATRTALEVLATEYLGPVAAFVCQSVFDRAGSTSEAIALLTSEIPDPSDAKAFETVAKRQLNV